MPLPTAPLMVRVHDQSFRLLISEAAIARRVKEIAQLLDREYQGIVPLFVVVLNGSFVFAADLMRQMSVSAEVCFVRIRSYQGMSSSGNVVLLGDPEVPLKGRHVVVLEDIVDTGTTLYDFLPRLQQQEPASLKLVSFLSKPAARKYAVYPDLTGFEISDRFVVGYGLDYDGLGRHLPALYVLSEDSFGGDTPDHAFG